MIGWSMHPFKPWPESIPDVYCNTCSRLLRWFKNQMEPNPNVWMAVCCDRPFYHEVKP